MLKYKTVKVFVTDGIAELTAWEQKSYVSTVWAILPY